MPVQLSVPVTVTPEAAARVAELGFEQVVAELVAQALRLLPGLIALRWTLVESYEMDEVPWLVLECHGDLPERDARDNVLAWYQWRAGNVPEHVARHFMLNWIHDEDADAR